MKIRLAVPAEAEECWNIRNQAIRHGCKNSYDDTIITAWTPENMPASYRGVIVDNPFLLLMVPIKNQSRQAFLTLFQAALKLFSRYRNLPVKGWEGKLLTRLKMKLVNVDLSN